MITIEWEGSEEMLSYIACAGLSSCNAGEREAEDEKCRKEGVR